jgi:GWxTD domain-containing protein
MKLRSFSMAIAVAGLAISATAAVSNQYSDWAKGPASYLMTASEVDAWKKIGSDKEAQQFVDLFWARRDPTPGTARNEFHEEFDRRVATADQVFSVRKTKGSMTDRGKVLIVVGPPKRVVNQGNSAGPDANFESGVGGDVSTPQGTYATTMGGKSPTTMFVYEQETVPAFAPGADFAVTFVDAKNSRDYKVDPVAGRIAVSELLEKARNSYITQPNLTVADMQAPARTQTVTVPAPVIETAPATSFKSATYGTAVTSFKAASTSPYKGVYSTYGEYVTPKGEYFVPLQLFFNRDSGVKADTPVTFFGQVEDETGKVVAVYEEPATLVASKNDVFFDKSLILPSGKYVGYFGVADNTGKILGMSKSNLELSSIDKSAPGTSRLLISNNLYALPKAQLPTDPYAFGGLKVVPKSDHTFSKDDELDYFIELRNPGIDATTGKPRFQMKVTIEDEKGGKRTAPLAEADVQPVKGVEGHWWLGSGYDVKDFTPGKYKLKIKLIDMVTKQNYDLEEPFRVVG